MNHLKKIVERFQNHQTYGMKVFVLPESYDMWKPDRCSETILKSFDPKTIVALGHADDMPYRSIRDALVNGYSRFVGESPYIADLIRLKEAFSDESSSEFKDISEKEAKIFDKSPVTPLHHEPYTAEILSQAIRALCEKAPLVLYLQNAYDDRQESRRFLYEKYALDLKDSLGENKIRFLGILCIQSSSCDCGGCEKGCELEDLKRMKNHAMGLELFDVDEKEHLEGDLHSILEEASHDTMTVMKYIAVYCKALSSLMFPKEFIEESCGLAKDTVAASMEWLKEKHVISPWEQIFGLTIWKVAQDYDVQIITDTIYDLSFQEDKEEDDYDEDDDENKDYDEDEDKGEDEDGYDEDDDEDEDEDDYDDWEAEVSSSLLGCLSKKKSQNLHNIPVLYRLSKTSEKPWEALSLASDWLEILSSKNSFPALSYVTEELDGFAGFLEFRAEHMEEQDYKLGVAQGLQKLSLSLDKLGKTEWEECRNDLAYAMRQISHIKGVPKDATVEDCINKNTPYLYFVSQKGHMKLVSIFSHEMNDFVATPCIRNPERDGLLSQLQNVVKTNNAIFFCTNGDVIHFPLSGLDAVYDDQPDLIMENMAICLGLRKNWKEPSDYVALSASYKKWPSEGGILLANEAGQAYLVPLSSLPQEIGGQTKLECPILSRSEVRRWAIWLKPDDEILIITSENHLLRLGATEFLSKQACLMERIVAMEDGAKILSIAKVEKAKENVDMEPRDHLILMTEHGYGNLVPLRDFTMGKVGDKGTPAQKCNVKTGNISVVETVSKMSTITAGTKRGNIFFINTNSIPVHKRNSAVSEVIAVAEDDAVVCVCKI